MLTTFLDTLGGFFDRRFIIAYWAPVFIGSLLSAGVLVARFGIARSVDLWAERDGWEHIGAGLAALLVVTILAFMLQALTLTVVRFYEGFLIPDGLRHLWLAGQEQTWQTLYAEIDNTDPVRAQKQLHVSNAYRAFYFGFPSDKAYLRPTRLGNVLTAAEESPFKLYTMDAVLWWPRLMPLVPDPLRTQIDDAFASLVALLNLCTMFVLFAVGGGSLLLLSDDRWWVFAVVFGGGLVAAMLCYRVAVVQAVDYGSLVRVVFDLYRHDLIAKLHVPLPKNLVQEMELWTMLNNWIYDYVLPWESKPSDQPGSNPDPGPYPGWRPFPYDFDAETGSDEDSRTPTGPTGPAPLEAFLRGEFSVDLGHQFGRVPPRGGPP
jgi:hypothetical protein